MRSGLRIFLFALLNSIIASTHGQVTFIIESLPSSTPETDTIFICGSFNNWEVNDNRYMLHSQLNGTYSITFPVVKERLEYKFTRGSWMKVETNNKNEYLPNRVYIPGGSSTEIIKIANWQDLGGAKRFNYIVLFLFGAAFNGIALLFLAFRIQKRNLLKFKIFYFLNLLIVFTLIGGVLHNQTNLIWQSHISLGGYMILFCWGPTIYVFLRVFREQTVSHRIYFHYFPVLVIAILTIMRLINWKFLTFFQKDINSNLNWGNSIILWVAAALTAFYHMKSIQYLQLKGIDGEKIPRDNQLINIVFFISGFALLFMGFNYFLLLKEVSWSILMNFELVLIIISLIIIIQLYYFWKFPEILRDKNTQLIIGNADDLISELFRQMEMAKPYKNPELNIAELSEIINTKPHILSKVLNEHFNKNFRDFINEYRVKEFIKMSISEKYKNYTFLALAHEVGFNSKSTFNLAFKKQTGLSPSEYLKQNHNIIID